MRHRWFVVKSGPVELVYTLDLGAIRSDLEHRFLPQNTSGLFLRTQFLSKQT